MRRALILVALAGIALPCEAQSICRAYEYAELKDMSPDALTTLYCDYRRAMHRMLDAALLNARSGYTAASQRDASVSNRCAQELERIERILQAKPSCP